jgi:ectoine hydroxylase-related dioxygenase (phytanoyl-CoA dioxygenase family)
MLTPFQIDQMEKEGFVVLESLFTPDEITSLDHHLSALHQEREAELLAKGANDGISRAGEVLFSGYIAENNSDVKEFIRHPKLIDLTTQLLGEDVDLYYNQTVYKHPEGEKEFPWHQDDAYTPVTPSPYLTCWLAISDATPDNGCISVLPGSHHKGLQPHTQSPIGLVGYSSDAPDQGIQVPVGKGSLIVFWSTVLHKSGPNLSNDMRKAYVIQYSKHGLTRISDGYVIPDLIPVARQNNVVRT